MIYDEKCEVDGCQIDKTGVCAMHGIEIERRRNTDKELAELKDTAKSLATTSADISSKQSRLYGLLTVAVLVVSASFVYTTITWIENSSAQRESREQIRQLIGSTHELLAITNTHSEAIQNIVKRQEKHEKLIEKQLDNYIGP